MLKFCNVPLKNIPFMGGGGGVLFKKKYDIHWNGKKTEENKNKIKFFP